MASVITVAFENWKAQEAASGKAVLLDEFVFANVPNLDPSQPIDRNEKLPPANQIVHSQAVNKAGLASENAVAYSVTLGAEVGNFDFNWIGLLNKASGTVAMITHAPLQKKLKTQNGQQGNVLTRSFILEFQGAAEETQIKTSAETWQIDFTARLSGIDEMQRLINVDSYGAAAFFNDGFEVTRSGEQYTVKKGLGYVGGLRGELAQNQILNGLRNTKVYADFSYQGNIVSQWNTVVKITSAATLNNYIDAAGFTHQVFAIASIDASGNVKDLRSKGALSSQEISALETRLKLDLSKKIDKANITHQMGNSTELVVSQQLLATELGKKQPAGNYALVGYSYSKTESDGKYQPKGNYAPAGDYATNTALNNGLNQKFDKSGGILTGGITVGGNINSTGDVIQLSSKKTEVMLQLDANTSTPRINSKLKDSSTWRNHSLQDKSGTLAHTSDIDSAIASLNKIVPVGATLIWNTSAPIPENFWPNEGRSFSATDYPEAAKAMPSLKLPDDRGYAIRAADNGRGKDPGRTVGTYQEDAMMNLTGQFTARTDSGGVGTGVFTKGSASQTMSQGNSNILGTVSFNASNQVPTASEFRMKNVAKILITRMK
ncbi:phage tail protein [Providencia alcalifaciens]